MKIMQQKLDLERKLLNEKMEREKQELAGNYTIMYTVIEKFFDKIKAFFEICFGSLHD